MAKMAQNRNTDKTVSKTWEMCPHCTYENEFPADFKIHKCKECGKELLPCALCYVDGVDCSKCDFEREAK